MAMPSAGSMAASFALAISAAITVPAVASPGTCSETTENEWLTPMADLPPADDYRNESIVRPDRVHPVTKNFVNAIQRLQRRSIVALSSADARRYIGKPASDFSTLGLRPYLVRTVFLSEPSSLDVRVYEEKMTVFAGGLGCYPYTKHPIVVFVDKRPKRIIVAASAAM